MRAAAVDQNHFQVTANTDGQILFSILMDKDYPQRMRIMNLRKFWYYDGMHVDNFGSYTALKVKDVSEQLPDTQIHIWNANQPASDAIYIELYGVVGDVALPEQGAGFRFSTSSMSDLPILAVITQGAISIYEVG